jgi:carbonic anhydrase
VSVTDELVSNARSYEKSFDVGDLPLPPAKRVAIVACMDARLNPLRPTGAARRRRARDSERWRRHHR